MSFVWKCSEEAKRKKGNIAAMQIIRHENKEKLHMYPTQVVLKQCLPFLLTQFATDYLYYFPSMIQVYLTCCILYLILGNNRKRLLFNTSHCIRWKWKCYIAWTAMNLSFQKAMKLYSFSLALYLGFSFMSHMIRKGFGFNSAIFL